MAPLRPSSSSSKPSATAKLRKVVLRAGTRSSYPTRTSENSLGDSKRDKRQVKHSLLLSRAAQSSKADSAGVRKRPLKRRRTVATKGKLNTDLSALLDTLPDAPTSKVAESSKIGGLVTGSNITIASKPGAQKKKEKVAQAERERMGKNLAAMAAGGASASAITPALGTTAGQAGTQVVNPSSAANKWAAIRAHIARTLAGAAP